MGDRKRTFEVTVSDTVGGPHDARRLAGWLKVGLRRFGLRCVEVREAKPAPGPGRGGPNATHQQEVPHGRRHRKT